MWSMPNSTLTKRFPSKSDANMNGTGSCMSMGVQTEGHQCTVTNKSLFFFLQEQVKLMRWEA